MITDLSSLGAPSTQPPPAVASPTARATPFRSAATSGGEAQGNLTRLFLENPSSERFSGTAAAPGEVKLLNSKAARFGPFSQALLHQLFVATQELERKELANKVLSTNLQPVVILATMDKAGKLTELLVEQHSGSGAVDQLMVKACEKGLWAANPPVDALASDGSYHLRVQAKLSNFNRTTQANIWNFETDLGLALE